MAGIGGHGPFSDLAPELNIASLQMFVTSIVMATFLVAVLQHERDEVLERLRDKDLQQSEKRYRALVDHATDAIVILDVDAGTFIEANPRAAQLFGIPVEDLIGFDDLTRLAARPRDISSRSIKLSARRDLMRSGGRMPPVIARCGKIEDEARSNRRPIEPRDSPPAAIHRPAGDVYIAERDPTSLTSVGPYKTSACDTS